VEPLGAVVQLADRLGSAQHERRQQRDTRLVDLELVAEHVPVLRGPVVRAVHDPDEPRSPERREGTLDVAVLVAHHRIPGGRLVAGEAERVEGERVRLGRGALLLDQAAEHPALLGGQVHNAHPRSRPGTC
jgi:hypothetical protein